MKLQTVWQRYNTEGLFNYSDISEHIGEQQQEIVYPSGRAIVEKGDFPSHIYFIIDGIAVGQRHYEDGNEYSYFQVDKSNGNIGLLEILSRKEQYVATITCLTEVKAVKVDAAFIYELLMNDLDLLRKCTFLLADDLYSRSGNDGIYYYYTGLDRVRLFLINYFNEKKPSVVTEVLQVDMSYEEIANQIGVSVRTVGRSVQKLKESGEVTTRSKKIMLSLPQYQQLKKELQK